jgi:UDP-glucose 4-epimerase
MKVLVSGGAGFIGSHLAEAMLARGWAVTVVDDLSTGRRENLAGAVRAQGFRFVEGSVRDEPLMADLVEQCDAVVHLAAAVGVQLIVDQPVRTLETNIHGTEVVLAQACRFGRRILIASSSEVYGKSERIPFSEDDDATFGSTRFSRWSYACSKMADEFLALAYHAQFGLETILVRLFNTIGPRQRGAYGMVAPRFVRRALRGEPLEVYGSGRQSRTFCCVADVCRALIALLACDAAVGEVINLGGAETVTIRDLAERIIALTGSNSEIRLVPYAQAYGPDFDDLMVRRPDLSKIKRLIGFAPQFNLTESLQSIIQYEKLEGIGP